MPLYLLPLQNSYGTGLTDWDNCSMYGKLALFIFAAWAGAEVRLQLMEHNLAPFLCPKRVHRSTATKGDE